MCGFITLFKNTILKEDEDKVREASEKLIHRGPDDFKIAKTEKVIFGFRRLSIVDIKGGAQPFLYKDKYIIVFNGEIYNYLELKKRLRKEGRKFKTNSEIEVISAMYEKYGGEFIKHLRGMFSIVLYDIGRDRLLAYRDIFGIKPLYYLEDEEEVWISSELKALVKLNKKLTYSKEEINNYLTVQYIPGEKTLFKEIKLLMPGCVLIKEKGKLKVKRYGEVKLSPKHKKNKESLKKEIYKVLDDSVRKHMIADVPVATFLSSGIDSSITTYLAWKLNKNITAYSIGFDVEGYDETPYAKRFAEKFNISFKEVKLSCKDFIEELPKIIYHMDSPIADPSIIPLYHICKEVSGKFKVVLSGEGSDEFFGGYNIYTEDNSLKIFKKIPKGIKKVMLASIRIVPNNIKGKNFIERGCTDLEKRYVGNARIFKDREKSRIIKNYDRNLKSEKITREYFEKVKLLDNVAKRQFIDINTWLVGDILAKADRMSMAHSLELRVPFLDKEVFKVASKLEREDKINGFTTKYMLREAFKGILPEEVYQKKKLGYPVPLRLWFKNELYDWAKEIIEGNPVKEIDTKEALKLLRLHKKTRVDYSRKIWTIIVYIIWYKIYIDKTLDKNEKLYIK
ncbi:MAG: asparagine synthase (glutamine-hydrolyzing) [Clostridium sp.]|uniref:asparagine synthase (glutamine-hydrolyzing) n=1 Tax=Clostridium sp. TaxID=1506 RepID=UPI003EE5E592